MFLYTLSGGRKHVCTDRLHVQFYSCSMYADGKLGSAASIPGRPGTCHLAAQHPLRNMIAVMTPPAHTKAGHTLVQRIILMILVVLR